MILGLGVDLVDVAAFGELCRSQPFLIATFSDDERGYATAAGHAGRDVHLAARYAAKEAALKALDAASALVGVTPPAVPLGDIEVVRDARGRPALRWHGRAAELASALEVRRTHLSLTHDGRGAAAVVALEA
ncbi:MAG: 4'-phosphopantetheinyl transferase superfamily protein [Deltaproteobacteria bacterium]|nr:4'-phosphopantetheinyl transferase superfamily protein [Deltaproteobacteria bacterium]